MRYWVVLALALAGCSADDGFAVDLTVVAAPAIAGQASSIATLSFAVRGAESADDTVTLQHAFSTERIRYRPKNAGVVTISVSGSDGSGIEIGYGEVLVQTQAGSAVAATVTLDKPKLVADQGHFDFGTVVVGNIGGPATMHVSNLGDTTLGPLTVQLEGADAGSFTIGNDSCNATLDAGAGCAVDVSFTPSATGQHAAFLAVTVAGAAVRVSLTGTAAPAGVLSFAPSMVDCGNVLAKQPAVPRDVTLTNNGTTPTATLSLTTTGTDMSAFSLSADGCSGSSLMPGASCTLKVQFSPTTTGVKSAQLNATDGVNFASASLVGHSQVLLSATVNVVGTATGKITAGSAGSILNCPGTCQASVDTGGAIALVATPGPGFSFAGWGGDCAAFGISPTCSVTIDGNKNVSASFTTAVNYIFTSSAKITPSMLGQPAGTDPLKTADTFCNNLATAANLKGTFVAWMSTTSKGAIARLGKARGWFRTDGKPFSDMPPVPQPWVTWYPPRLDEKGNDLGVAANVDGSWIAAATGTGQDGNAFGLQQNCNDWTSSANSTNLGVGNAAGGGSAFTYGGSYSSSACDQQFRIYCMGTDYYTPVTVTRQTGRVAFMSKGTFDLSTGIAGADTICKNEAKAAGLSNGTTPAFLSLLATTTASAASRFADGMTWVRPDGIPVVDKATDLLGGTAFLVAPIVVSADGSGYDTQSTATGATNVTAAGTAATTCNNWSNKTTSFQVTTGYASSSINPAFFGGITYFTCDQTFLRVYCLQQ
jgi:hypothetical protein